MKKVDNRILPEGLSIHVHRLEKRYQLYGAPIERLLQIFWEDRRKDHNEIWALRPLSLKVRKGETIGIIGENGSGKSTLLKMICGVLKPSGGSVQVEGRLGALLELGSGFNPEFTGLENIYLNGSILGLSQHQITQKLETILRFADIGKFVERPLRTYSSGMALRLAFAVQACVDPDVLVIDEALAVGDELFQKKCFNRLNELKEQGTSILFVTHSCPSIVEHCDRALLLERGFARWLGRPDVTTTLYQRLNSSHEKSWDAALIQYGQTLTRSRQQEQPIQPHSTRREEVDDFMDPSVQPESTLIYPNKGIRIENITILNQKDQAINTLTANTPFSLVFDYYSERALTDLQMACHIANVSGARITGQIFPSRQGHWAATKAGENFSIRFRFHGGLLPGLYFIGGGIRSQSSSTFLHRVIDFKALRIQERQDERSFGLCDLSAAPAEFLPAEPSGKETSSL
ncbi:MAG: ABC transporter ATP-binding protein [Cyanobacteriota bacterium]|nr:ABC transporter ATP-binding protein [Cyanobacteriota bacterium]